MTFTSICSSSIPLQTHYVVGALRQNAHGASELHLTPVNGMLQFRPSFDYLDESDKRRKEKKADKMDDDIAMEDDEPTAVKVTFKKRENEAAILAKKKSHAFFQQQREEEPWVDFEYTDETVQASSLLPYFFYFVFALHYCLLCIFVSVSVYFLSLSFSSLCLFAFVSLCAHSSHFLFLLTRFLFIAAALWQCKLPLTALCRVS